jgi:DNA repair exonuclease SbcCD ATPase subunit
MSDDAVEVLSKLAERLDGEVKALKVERNGLREEVSTLTRQRDVTISQRDSAKAVLRRKVEECDRLKNELCALEENHEWLQGRYGEAQDRIRELKDALDREAGRSNEAIGRRLKNEGLKAQCARWHGVAAMALGELSMMESAVRMRGQVTLDDIMAAKERIRGLFGRSDT